MPFLWRDPDIMLSAIITTTINRKYTAQLRTIINIGSGKHFKSKNYDKYICTYEGANIFIDFQNLNFGRKAIFTSFSQRVYCVLHTFILWFWLGDPFLSGCQECANLMKFSTKDVDNDNDTIRNCARVSKGGWWHNSCQRSNLNGEFGQSNYTLGINWNTFTDLSYVEMRVRRP